MVAVFLMGGKNKKAIIGDITKSPFFNDIRRYSF
jgi:hypothetical protein